MALASRSGLVTAMPVVLAAGASTGTWAAFAFNGGQGAGVDPAVDMTASVVPLVVVLTWVACGLCALRWRLLGGPAYLLAAVGLAVVAAVRSFVELWPQFVRPDGPAAAAGLLAAVWLAGAAMACASALSWRTGRPSTGRVSRPVLVAAGMVGLLAAASVPDVARAVVGAASGSSGNLVALGVWLWGFGIHWRRAGVDGFHGWVAAMLLLTAESRAALVLGGGWAGASQVFLAEAAALLAVGGLVALRRDLTAQKADLWSASDALDGVAASQRELLHRVGEHRHDLQSAVYCLGGTTTLLDETWDDLPSREKHRLVQALRAEVERMRSLVASDDVGESRPVRLRDVVQPLVLMDRARGHDVRLDLADGAVVEARPHDVAEIVRNLLDNAYRYAPYSPVTVAGRERDGAVELLVVDRGPGIPEAQREAVFARGFRSVAAEQAVSAGHGIGLMVSRRLAERQGGGLWVEETAGGGCSFVLSLPVSAAAPSARGVA